jgi:hypothetical protein
MVVMDWEVEVKEEEEKAEVEVKEEEVKAEVEEWEVREEEEM